VIELEDLTRRYGLTTAVDSLSFRVGPGVVTGFLGPNGAGKTTTMRMILGLERPTAGSATVAGQAYAALPAPMTEVGALLDAKAVHPDRTAHSHLLALARTHGIGRSRVDDVLDTVGLAPVARRRVGGFSLGMSQRLGLAGALLGDPAVLVLDEPGNGLDPDGILWIRTLLRSLAAQGRTILVSSHLMSEMALTADHLIVIGRGRLLADAPVEDVITTVTEASVSVRSPRAADLAAALRSDGASIESRADGELIVSGREAAAVGELAHRLRIPLHALTLQRPSLEEAFMKITHDSVEYQGSER
jgi:ABC-2 type transport system ATP-binding protein